MYLTNERGNEILFDIECYPNFFLVGFKSYVTGETEFFELSDWHRLDGVRLESLCRIVTLVGFNSINYDLPMLSAALYGFDCGQLFELSNVLIQTKPNQLWRVLKKYKFHVAKFDHIDLMQVAPSAAQYLGLKHYGARMHVPNLQELPYNPAHSVTFEQAKILKEYNEKDLIVTGYLRYYLDSAIKLRKEMSVTYQTDLRSLSDAQIAEKVIKTEILEATGVEPIVPKFNAGDVFKYKNPDYIRFFTPELHELHCEILRTVFTIDKDGKVRVVDGDSTKPATNLWKIKINNTTYKLGIGGLHSSEKSVSYYSSENEKLFDRDVASYYPQIILNQSLFPSHIGSAFLQTYRDIVSRRLQAKAAGDKSTANSLKITINGSFGKLGSRYSVFYSPDLLIQVTLTGQLTLLMLIEMLEWSGVRVVSANTDGIVCLCPQERENAYLRAVSDWEAITGFETEQTAYRSVHARDVNNYIAIGVDGSIKAKGQYTNELSFKDRNREALMTNPNASIVSEAVMLLLRDNIPIEKTIKECRDLTKFLLVRRATGGGMKDGVYLGKICRWYIRENDYGCIQTVKPNKAGINAMVSESNGAQPVQTITDSFPTDLNYSWYIEKAKETLVDLGVKSY